MRTEFRQAVLPDELRSLMAFDRKVFSRADAFDASMWRQTTPYWMIVDGERAGCCAFEHHIDFREDIAAAADNPPLQGTLYISTTGILPRFQGRGLGVLLKAWEVAYARHGGLTRIVTTTRKRNAAMIALNRRFGFRILRTTPGYYRDPSDAAVVMDLRLDAKRARPIRRALP